MVRMKRRAFTLVELLLAMVVVAAIVMMLVKISGSAASLWRASERRTDAFRDGRAALYIMGQDLRGVVSQPGLPSLVFDTLRGEDDAVGAANQMQVFALTTSVRQGSGDLCAVGYYCQWDKQRRSYVLMRHFQDSDVLAKTLSDAGAKMNGFAPAVLFAPTTTADGTTEEPLAEFGWNFRIIPYDSRGRPLLGHHLAFEGTTLPAAIEISFDAISPNAVRPLADLNVPAEAWFSPASHWHIRHISPAMQSFRTRIEIPMGRKTLQ